jgi:hypothetical protein
VTKIASGQLPSSRTLSRTSAKLDFGEQVQENWRERWKRPSLTSSTRRVAISPCTITKPTRRPWWRPSMVRVDFVALFGRIRHEYQCIIVRLVTRSWMSHTSRHYRPLADRWSAA